MCGWRCGCECGALCPVDQRQRDDFAPHCVPIKCLRNVVKSLLARAKRGEWLQEQLAPVEGCLW